MQLNAGCSTRA